MDQLGLYIHIPFCVRKCNYCDFPSFPGLEGNFHHYTEALCKEIERIKDKYGTLTADTVFFGGGTPSLLSARDMARIMNTLSCQFIISKDAEIALEANPGTITEEKVKAYKSLGFNRISIGLQAAQDRLLQFMGRIHTQDMFLKSIDLVKNVGFHNVNADIIFGIPDQTMENWLETLDLVIRSGMTHISAYSLILEEGTPWFEQNENGDLPLVDDSLEREMYYKVTERTSHAGFHQYEISNFAKPGYESRHNLKYWTGKPYLGFGAAAHSFFCNERIANVSDPLEYIRRIGANLPVYCSVKQIGSEERLSERFMLGLRLINGVSLSQLSDEFGQNALKKHMEAIVRLEKKKLLCIEEDRLKLTKLGLDFGNQVWMEFL